MKSIYYVVSIAVASLFISGCGEDRSHGVDNLSVSGGKTSWIYESAQGKKMVENNFVYVPGGFDVDGDGVDEGGFWLSKYEAKDDNTTDKTIDVSNITNFQNILANNFSVFNANSNDKKFDELVPQGSGYITSLISPIGLSASKVIFNESGDVVKNISPIEAVISLQNSQIADGYAISLPSEKQWMHLVKLIINNPKNWTGSEVGRGKLYQGDIYGIDDRRTFVLENSILGEDSFVPNDYAVEVTDLSGGVAEWTSGMVAIKDRFVDANSGEKEYSELSSVPSWWKPILDDKTILNSIHGVGKFHDISSRVGANDILAITFMGNGYVDNFSVVARGGSNSLNDEFLVGISAARLGYGPGFKERTVGFRASSDYLY
jgi:hypothetical protein